MAKLIAKTSIEAFTTLENVLLVPAEITADHLSIKITKTGFQHILRMHFKEWDKLKDDITLIRTELKKKQV